MREDTTIPPQRVFWNKYHCLRTCWRRNKTRYPRRKSTWWMASGSYEPQPLRYDPGMLLLSEINAPKIKKYLCFWSSSLTYLYKMHRAKIYSLMIQRTHSSCFPKAEKGSASYTITAGLERTLLLLACLRARQCRDVEQNRHSWFPSPLPLLWCSGLIIRNFVTGQWKSDPSWSQILNPQWKQRFLADAVIKGVGIGVPKYSSLLWPWCLICSL